MTHNPLIEEHRAVQAIAKAVLCELASTIGPADTERTIANRAVSLLATHGITETWYYECPAFVLLGSRSCLSISGREYRPGDEEVGLTNLITVDLSPLREGVWGDCARSFFVENGRPVQTPTLPEFVRGALTEEALHDSMRAFVKPDTTFAELFRFTNAEIRSHGFENLDFLGNVGHSIESRRDDRRYIEVGNGQRIGSTGLFTFEPHIRSVGGAWGFKHENIYYFSTNGAVQEL